MVSYSIFGLFEKNCVSVTMAQHPRDWIAPKMERLTALIAWMATFQTEFRAKVLPTKKTFFYLR